MEKDLRNHLLFTPIVLQIKKSKQKGLKLLAQGLNKSRLDLGFSLPLSRKNK